MEEEAWTPLDKLHSQLSDLLHMIEGSTTALQALPPHARVVSPISRVGLVTPTKVVCSSWAAEAHATALVRLNHLWNALSAKAEVSFHCMHAHFGRGGAI